MDLSNFYLALHDVSTLLCFARYFLGYSIFQHLVAILCKFHNVVGPDTEKELDGLIAIMLCEYEAANGAAVPVDVALSRALHAADTFNRAILALVSVCRHTGQLLPIVKSVQGIPVYHSAWLSGFIVRGINHDYLVQMDL